MNEILIKNIISETYSLAIKIKEAFSNIDKEQWTANIFCQEIMVQISHLQSIYYQKDIKYILENERELNDLSDEISDVYLQIINLNNLYFTSYEIQMECALIYKKLYIQINTSYNETLFIALSILIGQINESVMILTNYRFPLKREGTLSDERNYLKSKIGEFLIIVFCIAEKLNINIVESFKAMAIDANNFLKRDYEIEIEHPLI